MTKEEERKARSERSRITKALESSKLSNERRIKLLQNRTILTYMLNGSSLQGAEKMAGVPKSSKGTRAQGVLRKAGIEPTKK